MYKNYWEDFYAKQNKDLKPSLFARFVYDELGVNMAKVIELGCGNGRDAVFFANNKLDVIAVDQCAGEIKFLKNRYIALENIKFVCDDFTNLQIEQKFDVIYSRFTLHSISAKQEKNVINWGFNHLNSGGKFCIEVRGQKNEIHKKGTAVDNEPDAFIYNDHFRRFINFDKFCDKLKSIGFNIDYAEEKKGFAPFNEEDETYIRIIATK